MERVNWAEKRTNEAVLEIVGEERKLLSIIGKNKSIKNKSIRQWLVDWLSTSHWLSKPV